MNSEMLADFFARFSIRLDQSSLNHMERSIEKGKKSLEGLSLVVNKISGVFEHLKFAFAGLAGIEGVRKVFEVNTDLNNTFNQLVNATGSTETAKQQLGKIIDFADKTKMSILGLSESFGPFQNQMTAAGLSANTALDVFKKMQVAFAGAHLTTFQAQLSQRDVTEFISGAVSLERLKKMEIGLHTAIIPNITKKLGVKDTHEADAILKSMTGEKRAKLIAEVSYETYSKGQEEYEKGPMAALQNVKNKFTEISVKIGNSGFMDLAVKGLNYFANALMILGKVIDFTSKTLNAIKDAFSEMPAVMWSVTAAIGVLTVALNANKLALMAEVFVEKMLITTDYVLAAANGAVTISEIIMAAPLWLIVAGVMAIISVIALLVDDIYTYFQGGKSIFGAIKNSLENTFQSFLKWFENLGILISTWIQQKLSHWVQIFDKFGEDISFKILAAFTKIKGKLTNILNDIKNLFYDSILGPIDKLWSKIEGLSGKPFSKIQGKFQELVPKLTEKVSMISPNIPNRDYNVLSNVPGISSSHYKTTQTTHTFAPSISVNVSNTQGMDERKLASHISSHVEKSLKNHYSSALIDATRRE